MRSGPRAALAAIVAAGAGLIVLAGVLGGDGARGQPAPTVPIGATVYVPFALALQPGQSITVPAHTPTPYPTATPIGATPGPPLATSIPPQPSRGFPPLSALFDIRIENDAKTQITVLGDGNNFTVTAYDGSIVQLRTTVPSTRGSGPVSPLGGCGPDSAQGNVVRCGGLGNVIGIPPTGPGPLVIAVTTAPQGTAQQQIDLDPGETAFLVWPQQDATAGPGPAISVANTADATASIGWDGATLTATLPDGEAIDGQVGYRLQPGGGSFAAIGCTSDAGPNSVSCPLIGLPQADVQIKGVPIAPTTPLSLPYTDRNGAGTLALTPSGPDPAPGGETVDATLASVYGTLNGSGVLRPEPYDLGEFQLLLAMQDPTGATYYVQGSLRGANGAWAGKGEIVAAADPAGIASWQAGDADVVALIKGGYGLGPRLVDQYGRPTGLPLPPLVDGRLIGAQTPPTVGTAGQPISFEVIGTMPLVAGAPVFGLDFGDGAPPQEGGQQTIAHTFAAPGVYTLLSYIINGSGQREFGVTQVAIAPAGG